MLENHLLARVRIEETVLGLSTLVQIIPLHSNQRRYIVVI